jgi:hypothetical protein
MASSIETHEKVGADKMPYKSRHFGYSYTASSARGPYRAVFFELRTRGGCVPYA